MRRHPYRRHAAPLALIVALTVTPAALAARDTGTVRNWSSFPGQVTPGTTLLPLTRPNSPELAVARGQMLQGGRFFVDLREDAADRLATPEPSCRTVRKSATLRTLFINALVTSGRGGLYELQRTTVAPDGTATLIDGWLYASERGTIQGTCTVGDTTGVYALNLAAGWNVVRLTLTRTHSDLRNAPQGTLPWTMRGP